MQFARKLGRAVYERFQKSLPLRARSVSRPAFDASKPPTAQPSSQPTGDRPVRLASSSRVPIPPAGSNIPPANRKQVLRWITHSRWFIVDQLERTQPLPASLKCRVCLGEAPTHQFTVHESYCRFGGGRLIRYECPTCGTIFGPLKVMNLCEPELAEEYRLLYEMYSEHDTSDNEIRTFHSLQPRKDGTYLNFGAGGGWNSAVDRLRGEGYNVFGFEPYADNSAPHIIRNVERLRQMRFDGIMSNNVLEHLTDPAETFSLFREILRDERSVMAHSTPCYEYRYAFTRFHLFFFTGQAIDHLCRRTGFTSSVQASEGEYICYRFQVNATARQAA